MIRIAYLTALGPDPDPNGVYIDFFGMATHVAAVAAITKVFRKKMRPT